MIQDSASNKERATSPLNRGDDTPADSMTVNAEDIESSHVGADETFPLKELLCLGEPFYLDENPEIMSQKIFLPTFQAYRKIQDNEELTYRRAKALSLGGPAIGKRYLVNSKSLSRKSYSVVFKKETELLDSILRDVTLVCSSDQSGYRIKRSTFTTLMNMLYSHLESAINAFRLVGETPPELPSWGRDWPISGLLSENDFEIVGICFRAEIEHFLSTLSEYFDFTKGLPKTISKTKGQESMETTQGLPRDLSFSRDRPPHLSDPPESVKSKTTNPIIVEEEVPIGSRRTTDYGNDITAIRKRQANVYNRGDNHSRKDDSPSGFPLPFNNRMLDIMEPMGSVPNPTVSTVRNVNSYNPNSFALRNNQGSSRHGPSPLRNGFRSEEDDLPENVSSISRQAGRPSGDPSDDDSSDDDHGNGRRGPRIPNKPPRRPNTRGLSPQASSDLRNDALVREAHFDLKLKPENVPKWNGNVDMIVRWFAKVNKIARTSKTVFTQLGKIVPDRLEGAAETWYWSLSNARRNQIEQNWDTLKAALGAYYMNRKWLDRQRAKANRASYRENGHIRETPSEYYIRKTDLLNTVYNMTDSEIIMEVMDGAPPTWSTVLTTQLYKDVFEFQSAINYHEDALLRLDPIRPQRFDNAYREREYPRTNFRNAHVNLVGWSGKLEPPKFPKDDSNVSKKATPADKGARPCRHCGSDKHWDPECKYSFKGNKAARANLVTSSTEEVEAQERYDELYYSIDSEGEDSDHSDNRTGEQDFCNTLRTTEQSADQGLTSQVYLTTASAPEGHPMILGGSDLTSEENQKFLTPSAASRYAIPLQAKPPLNRKTRRRLAKEIGETNQRTYHSQTSGSSGSIVELRKVMARPPGCSFLGSRATQATANIGSLNLDPTTVIVDSGSDITLISQALLDTLTTKPRLKTGQRINLIQVTGKSSISGYVNLDLYFHTKDGPVKMDIEAYVVKGMSTPFILGNDFADQYSISIVRNEGESKLIFGDSGRELQVFTSTSPSLMDEDGHAFKIRTLQGMENFGAKSRMHRRNQKIKKRIRARQAAGDVRSAIRTLIPPETSIAVPIATNFPQGVRSLFVERKIAFRGEGEDAYGTPDCIISEDRPVVHIANFSKVPIIIPQGQLIGTAHNPRNWLDRSARLLQGNNGRIEAHATFIRMLAESKESEVKENTDEGERNIELNPDPDSGLELNSRSDTVRSETEISSKAQRNATEPDDPLAEEPIEGGPKTAKGPEDPVNGERLLEELDISPDISQDQRRQIEQVIIKNRLAFGLDGRLGNYDAHVDIQMKPEAVPVSLPPFPASPANREVMDKQMDSWIQLGVIEPSKSPWGAPVFITYRNGKPRMVIDLRKMNEMAVSDEFPIPRRDDILQALTGSQWLSTLDALAGFTQLTMTDSAAEKLAFRTHRGLWQFRRMPFGYKNGPSVFQRIMQNILAPFLWIFALVYIDDIVIFSLTFEDHIKHLDQVFSAIGKARLTLSPSKCHFAYQSLLLLGQKVSRLGLSTHKEKVDAILQLQEPQNVHDLQMFLGMMVYFSAYIPFYSWIAHPFFQLLRKDKKWEWTTLHQEAFELCKQVLTNAPVQGYAMASRPYRVYTDACDFGLAGILQQVQPISVRDLKGTKTYDRLLKAYKDKEPIPRLVVSVSKEEDDVPEPGNWATDFEDTVVFIERVVCYWSRILKSAERNYSPTEREALALKEALIKFQPFIEGERVVAITDHAALTWSRTFQNVNRRLLTWGTVFSAYPKLKIIHRAGRVHSNVDPISRLRRRIPPQEGPATDRTKALELREEDPLKDMYTELGPRFEESLLTVASKYVHSVESKTSNSCLHTGSIMIDTINNDVCRVNLPFTSSRAYTVVVGISEDEVKDWGAAYESDIHFSQVLAKWRDPENDGNPLYPQYHYSDNGLIYFEDWEGNSRLCVPKQFRVQVMDEVHNTLTESAHGGYHKCYNRLASTYYWPQMSRDIKKYVATCDICQKSKPRQHAPTGLLQPIPIPTQPFEVVSMDFIPELPSSNGFDNILVIVDKLTKYGIFIPCNTTITEEETAKLFFSHVIAKFGIPKQVITDRDARWKNDFWMETCRLMGMKRSLTTSYHPQADGQTEILNQSLEITLRAYIGPSRDDWSVYLDGLALSYNSTPHTGTGFSPAFLLRGYSPVTSSTLLSNPLSITRPSESGGDTLVINDKAQEMVDQFETYRSRAKEALLLSQVHQRRAYNRGRQLTEFEEGDFVVLNPHSLNLLRSEKGRGQKLLMRYDGPFEVIRKLSPVTYQIRMPASYGIHPVLNIAHLEKYSKSPKEFGERPSKKLNREDFEQIPEYEVELIVDERWRKKGNRKERQFKTRFIGYGPEADEWLSKRDLRNAPMVVRDWEKSKGLRSLTEGEDRNEGRVRDPEEEKCSQGSKLGETRQ